MADRKTHLRELGVGFCIHILISNKNIDFSSLKVDTFKNITTTIFSNDIQKGLSNLHGDFFGKEDILILENAFKLSQLIIEKLPIKGEELVWLGNDTQKSDNIDLIIDGFKFSLKEESYILENMGLYKLINLITGESRERGKVHIFYDFAKEDFFSWFNYTWNKLKEVENWRLEKGSNTSQIYKREKDICFKYNDIEILLDENTDYDTFKNKTNPKIREKVFAKWVKETLESDDEYIKIKRNCSEKAGANLVSYLKDNYNKGNSNLKRLLQIHNEEYFYGKTTTKGTFLYKVPGLSNFSHDIEIMNIESSIPKSQLNIITTLKNNKTEKSLILRNELRYSHGQFNGTPEAKMYYDSGSSLDIIYYSL